MGSAIARSEANCLSAARKKGNLRVFQEKELKPKIRVRRHLRLEKKEGMFIDGGCGGNK